MNVCSLFLIQNQLMKQFVLKIGLVLPVVCFSCYILMAIVGCVAGFFHCGNDFYCGPFCLIGKIIGGFAVFLFFFSILPDIKAFLNIRKHASSKKK